MSVSPALMLRDYAAIAAEYARAVLSGEIPACLQVRRMCERQERDLSRQGTPGQAYCILL